MRQSASSLRSFHGFIGCPQLIRMVLSPSALGRSSTGRLAGLGCWTMVPHAQATGSPITGSTRWGLVCVGVCRGYFSPLQHRYVLYDVSLRFAAAGIPDQLGCLLLPVLIRIDSSSSPGPQRSTRRLDLDATKSTSFSYGVVDAIVPSTQPVDGHPGVAVCTGSELFSWLSSERVVLHAFEPGTGI